MKSKRCLFVLFFVLSLWYSVFAGISSAAWTTTTVDSAGDVGVCTSIALDGAGKAYISYFDLTNSDLKYATNASGSWVTTTVDTIVEGLLGTEFPATSIALDAAGKAHISYYQWEYGEHFYYTYLMYTTNASGAWVSMSVDEVGHGSQYTSIAVDTSGNAHISYFESVNGDLKYVTNASGSWVTTTVDSAGDVGAYNSIALDTAGKAYISYYDLTNFSLKYATNASGNWVTTTVDSAGDVGRWTSIALDTAGKAYISYFDLMNSDLKYATNASGSWVTTTVDSDGDLGFHCGGCSRQGVHQL